MSEDTAQEQRSGATSRAAKAREELAAVPSQDLPDDLAAADDLDSDDELDEEADLDEAVDLEDLEDLEDLGDTLDAEDLEIADTPDAELTGADLPDDSDGDDAPVSAAGPAPRPTGPPAPPTARPPAKAATTRSSSSVTTTTTSRPPRWPWRERPPTRLRTT